MYIHQHYKPYVCCSKCFQKSWRLQVHIALWKSIWKTNMYGEREHVRDTSMATMPFFVLDDFKVFCWLSKPMPIEGHLILGFLPIHCLWEKFPPFIQLPPPSKTSSKECHCMWKNNCISHFTSSFPIPTFAHHFFVKWLISPSSFFITIGCTSLLWSSMNLCINPP